MCDQLYLVLIIDNQSNLMVIIKGSIIKDRMNCETESFLGVPEKDVKTETEKEKEKEKEKVKKKKKCFQCKTKLSLIVYTCKCKHIFCHKHLNAHSHNCLYDYKKERKKQIEENNPKLESKIEKI